MHTFNPHLVLFYSYSENIRNLDNEITRGFLYYFRQVTHEQGLKILKSE